MPGPIRERAEFDFVDGGIVPISYTRSEESGEKSGRNIRFDWENARAAVSTQGQTDLVALQPGTLDPGSTFVALLLTSPIPGASWSRQIVDDGAIAQYEYNCTGEVELETNLGRRSARLVSQQRQGSTRRSLVWLAPVGGDPPYRIEQQKNGATEISFVLVETSETGSKG